MTIIEVCGVDREAARRGWEGFVLTNLVLHTPKINSNPRSRRKSCWLGSMRPNNEPQHFQQRLTTPFTIHPLINNYRVSCGITRPAAPRAAGSPCPSTSSFSSSSCWRPPSRTRLWRRRRVACTLLYGIRGSDGNRPCRRRVVCVRLVCVCFHRNAAFLGKERDSRPIGFGFSFKTNWTDPSIHRLTHAIHPALQSAAAAAAGAEGKRGAAGRGGRGWRDAMGARPCAGTWMWCVLGGMDGGLIDCLMDWCVDLLDGGAHAHRPTHLHTHPTPNPHPN